MFYAPIGILLTRFPNKYRLLKRILCRFDHIFFSIWPESRGPLQSSNARRISMIGRRRWGIIPIPNRHRFSNIYPIDSALFSRPISLMLSILSADQSRNLIYRFPRIMPLSIPPAFAIACDQHIRNKLSTLARERTTSIDYLSMLSEEQFDIKRYIYRTQSRFRKERGRKVRKGRNRIRSGGGGEKLNLLMCTVKLAMRLLPLPPINLSTRRFNRSESSDGYFIVNTLRFLALNNVFTILSLMGYPLT